MSARDELIEAFLGDDTRPHAAERAERLVDAYRDEVLREVAAKQRKALADYDDWRGGTLSYPREVEEWVIDPIDPDKAPS